MPYNTRRKSLSLPSLGIHLPISHAERAANAAAAAAANNLNNSASNSPTSSMASPSPSVTTEMPLLPPSKKIKRSHCSASPTPMSPPPSKREPQSKGILNYENTPPPSPEAQELDDGKLAREIDLEGINDDIVEGVIVQLQQTANRPHLVKELAAILSQSVKIVETSANPSAIISSRLSAYLKRPCWSAQTPCPLAKELETVHPRRTYFYLTTCPHQPIPDPLASAATTATNPYQHRSIISPSLSGASSRDDEERRRELSPSPEIDLSPDFGDDYDEDDSMVTPPTPTGSFSGRNSIIVTNSPSAVMNQNHRAASPPLQEDEREFTLTAQGMQTRKPSVELSAEYTVHEDGHLVPEDSVAMNMEVADSLFGTPNRNATAPGEQHGHVSFSSPALKASLTVMTTTSGNKRGFEEMSWEKPETGMDWDNRSPEVIELDELDGLLDDF